jgi:hypothetical protein
VGLFTLILLAGQAVAAEERIGDPEDLDANLLRAVRTIRQGFSENRTGPILGLIPANSKVFLSVEAIAAEASYYSRDQIQTLLRKTFKSHRTVRFVIKIDCLRRAGGGTEVILCPAAWVFRHKGMEKKMKIRFVLSRHEARWTLREIRETR